MNTSVAAGQSSSVTVGSRRCSYVPTSTFARGVAAALAIFSGEIASATISVFDDADLSFKWEVGVPPFIPGTFLDPTLPAAAQTGLTGPHSFGWSHGLVTSSDMIVSQDMSTRSGTGRVVRGTQTFTYTTSAGPWTFTAMKTFNVGDSIGSGQDWQFVSSLGAQGFSIGDQWFLGPAAYVGLQFNLADGTHYGWVHLTLESTGYQPSAWAYETLPNTAAAVVPAPGAQLMVAALGFAASRRKR